METFQPDSHAFTDDCRLCVYKLLSKFSTRDIPSVIETVFDQVGCKANKLPKLALSRTGTLNALTLPKFS